MVRLKVRQYRAVMVRQYISIPYGAIKSYEVRHKSVSCGKFQFLMVRLKAH